METDTRLNQNYGSHCFLNSAQKVRKWSWNIHDSQDMEATEMSIDRWMDKDVVHIQNGTLLSHKKEWNNVVCSTDGLGDHQTSLKDHTAYHLYVKFKTWHKWTYLETDSETLRTDLWLSRRRRVWGGMDWEFGISRWKLINNKVLLYSTGNHIQYPVINNNGMTYDSEKECICV